MLQVYIYIPINFEDSDLHQFGDSVAISMYL